MLYYIINRTQVYIRKAGRSLLTILLTPHQLLSYSLTDLLNNMKTLFLLLTVLVAVSLAVSDEEFEAIKTAVPSLITFIKFICDFD